MRREIVALANFQGGRILLGVEDDGTVTGIRRDDLEPWVMDTVFGRKVHPMILPFYEEIPVDDRHKVAVISFTQGTTKPYVVRHNDREEIYVRVGQYLATRYARAASAAVRGRRLVPRGVAARLRQRVARSEQGTAGRTISRPSSAPPETPTSDEAWGEQLCGLGFMTERPDALPVCTIAGLALFGHRPRRLLGQAGVRWMAFEGRKKDYRALDDRVIDGPLIALWREASGGRREIAEKGLIELLVDAMQPFVSAEEEKLTAGAMRRERSWRYPPEALRETVVNALAHRDWTRHEEVEIISYADRLEVLSPGALPNGMTVKKMLMGQRSARNSLIAEVLRDYGYVDARGMGVRNKIIPSMRAQNGVDPEFEAKEDCLRLTLRRGARAAS